MPGFGCSSCLLAVLAVSVAGGIPTAVAQSQVECAPHLSDCHVDTRLEMAGIANAQQAKIFLDRLKEAARTGDRKRLAALVKYPLTVRGRGQTTTYHSAARLLRAFDSVFTRSVLNAIESSNYKSLFVNSSGAMIGDGEIWFDGWNGRILIKAISPTLAASTGVSGGMERIFKTQEALNSLGYAAGASDGRMGPRTRKALAAFQRAQGLQVTSEIDAKTLAALSAAREKGGAPPASQSAAISPQEIVRKIYSTLGLAPAEERQLMEIMRASEERERHFAPRLVALLDTNDVNECIDFSFNVNGQDYDSAEIMKTLKIDAIGDGNRQIIDAVFSNFGKQNHFRYEFIREGKNWKIVDIASLQGAIWRLSAVSCAPLPGREASTPARASSTP